MPFAIVAVGASLGGLCAVQKLLAALPAGFPLPVALVQHREPRGEDTLTPLLSAACALPVVEMCDKQAIAPGRVYVAPADYHALVDSRCFALSIEAPVNFSRPSIDVLFESAADSYGGSVIGVILTGTSCDGARGLAAIKVRGGLTIVQDPKTAEARAMPEAALAAVAGARLMPLEEIGPFLAETVHVKGDRAGSGNRAGSARSNR